MTLNCLDLSTGAVTHFPAGSYYKQTQNEWRAAELSLMRMTWRAARIAHDRLNDPDRVTVNDMDFVSWVISTEGDEIDGHNN